MANVSTLEQYIEQQMRQERVPGLAIAIVKHQEIIYAKGFGTTSVEDNGVLVTPHTLFRIASTTKPFTGAAIMRFVEQGKLDLDCPVTAYIPWLKFGAAHDPDRVTLRMLMSHMAGLPRDSQPFGPHDWSGLERYMHTRVATYPLLFPPGAVPLYSNPGINICGAILEAVGGKLFPTLVREHLLEPLDMTRTSFDPTVAMTYALAQAHELCEDGTLRVQHRYPNNTAEYPSGGLISTVLDVANFAIMFMHGGEFQGRTILSPQSVAEMQRPHARFYRFNSAGYGLTLELDTYKGLQRVGHGGVLTEFRCRFKMAPAAGVAVVIMINRRAGAFQDALTDHVFDLLLDLPPLAPPATLPADVANWASYIGMYAGEHWTGTATVQIIYQRLTLHWRGHAYVLEMLQPDLYVGRAPSAEQDIAVGFVSQATGPTDYLFIDGNPFQRVRRTEGAALDPASWGAYAGTYTNNKDTLTVRVDASQLFVTSARHRQETQALPLDNHRFLCEYGLVTFTTSQDGARTAIQLGRSHRLPRIEQHSGP